MSKTQIDSNDLIAIIQSGQTTFHDFMVFDTVALNAMVLQHELQFIDCTFSQFFAINNVTISTEIVFNNCSFDGGLAIHNTRPGEQWAGNISFFASRGSSLTLRQCAAGQVHVWHNCSFESVEFVGCEIPDISIASGELGTLKVDSCIFSDLTVERLQISSSMYVRGTETNYHSIDITGAKIDSLVLDRLTSTRIDIRMSTVASLQFLDIRASILLARSTFTGTCRLTSMGIRSVNHQPAGGALTVSGSKFHDALFVDGEHLQYDSIELRFSDVIDGALFFERFAANQITLHGTNTKGDIHFSSVQYGAVLFQRFINRSTVAFSGCAPNGTGSFTVNRSDLGAMKFLQHDFSRYETIRIEHSLISELQFSSCRWFNPERLVIGGGSDSMGKREVFRQLKHAAERQSDRIQSLRFHSLELQAYADDIRKTSAWWTGDRMILLLSRTNSFGHDWLKPIGLLLLITACVYMAMVVCISSDISWRPEPFSCQSWRITWAAVRSNSGVFVQLFNPAHNPTALVNPKKVAVGYFWWDGFHRIITTFLLVQIVAAFRKYVKS